MNLYAKLESERGGRPAKKGSNEQLNLTLYRGNSEIALLTFTKDEISIEVYECDDVLAPRNGFRQFILPKRIPVIKA